MHRYSQFKAFIAILKASFRSILSTPSALVFSFLFPVIFIFIFGSFGGGKGMHYQIAMSDNSDTSNEVYDSIKANPLISIVSFTNSDGITDTAARRKALVKDKISAIVHIKNKRQRECHCGFATDIFKYNKFHCPERLASTFKTGCHSLCLFC